LNTILWFRKIGHAPTHYRLRKKLLDDDKGMISTAIGNHDAPVQVSPSGGLLGLQSQEIKS
jgi:hypothetical protein